MARANVNKVENLITNTSTFQTLILIHKINMYYQCVHCAIISNSNQVEMKGIQNPLDIRCGHVVRDFESEAKNRCNFQF